MHISLSNFVSTGNWNRNGDLIAVLESGLVRFQGVSIDTLAGVRLVQLIFELGFLHRFYYGGGSQ